MSGAPKLAPIVALVHLLRDTRERVPYLNVAQGLLREPWYRMLEVLFSQGVSARLAGGENVRLHPRLLGLRPEAYEETLTVFLINHLKPGLTVIDVGAHVGLHTLMFSQRIGPTGHVLAIEPSPANARLLRSHIAWNDCRNVEVIEAIVGDREADVSFSFRADPTDPGGFANSLAYNIGGKTDTVPMTTIDVICAGRHPHLIKIDVEGAELLALRGACETLSRCAPMLIVAIHPEPMRMLGTSPTELVAFLAACGYQGCHLDGRRAVDPGFEEIVFTKQTGLE
jgi:FkbM family methyltransferase